MALSLFSKVSYQNPRSIFLLALIMFHHLFGFSYGQLKVGFYSTTCPSAESIVRFVVEENFHDNPRTAPILLRLHFHDCFVEGCDGSVLIDNGEGGERQAFGHQGLEGFDVIEKAKARLESVCKGVVSCADIVALAARDAVSLSVGPHYEVPTGRRDGRISKIALAANLPDVDDSIQLLKSKFVQKGLSAKDLVILSGAHSIGTTACFFMIKRLYNFTSSSGSDPSINPNFLPVLKTQCPFNGDVNVRIPLDPVTAPILDVQILRNIKNGFAVIGSDAKLYEDRQTKEILNSYIGARSIATGPFFKPDFAAAMVKLGQIGVKTGSEGEIRRVCNAVN